MSDNNEMATYVQYRALLTTARTACDVFHTMFKLGLVTYEEWSGLLFYDYTIRMQADEEDE